MSHRTVTTSAPLPRCGTAFTLVELLVVIGVIAVLLAILMPALASARQRAVGVKCLSNLRAMAQAAFIYCTENRGSFPPSLGVDGSWDYASRLDPTTGQKETVPGFLWGRSGGTGVLQCPAYDPRGTDFDTKTGALTIPFTGYNYNTSYVGADASQNRPSARLGQIRDAVHTALFGDAGFVNGSNRFMRSPHRSSSDPSDVTIHAAGGQAFRHRERTNVSFADGHAEPVAIPPDRRVPKTGDWASNPIAVHFVGPGNGFLSLDNSAYDLR